MGHSFEMNGNNFVNYLSEPKIESSPIQTYTSYKSPKSSVDQAEIGVLFNSVFFWFQIM